CWAQIGSDDEPRFMLRMAGLFACRDTATATTATAQLAPQRSLKRSKSAPTAENLTMEQDLCWPRPSDTSSLSRVMVALLNGSEVMTNSQEKRVSRIAQSKGYRLEKVGKGPHHGRF